MDEVLVSMEGIDKSFPGVHALDHCQFKLRAGEVHGLVGENGAGKSTLMKVLAGIYRKDSGRIFYKGKEMEIPTPKAAQNLGISIIHQELNLMPHLTIAENIFIGREPRKFKILLDDKALNAQTQQLFDMMNLQLDPRTRVSNLTVAKQQMVEIAKALSFNAEVLIMDEPTAALADAEIEELFNIIRQLRDQGVGVVYISHRLQELKQITDRVTVMRDGQYIGTVPTPEATVDQVIKMMIGRTVYETSPEIPENGEQEVVLEVKNLNRGKDLHDISFSLKSGEILGFAGLMGAGRTDVARAIFGADPIDSGEIYVKGRKVHINSPRDAVAHGIGYLSEDRKRYGVALDLDVETNIVLAAFRKFLRFLGWVNSTETHQTASHFVDALSIKTPSLQQRVKNLSGGNQQKVVIAKWLTAATDILIFDEPTRGIDVGAKSEIYKLLNDLVQEGKAIIMISSELPEILRMSHRIIVMCEGRITGELSNDEKVPTTETTDVNASMQEEIMRYATQRGEIVTTERSPSTG
jgi:ribose transport system ATP-binding protein